MKYTLIRIIKVTSDWPQLRRDHPGAHSVALVELPGGELALIPYVEEATA